MPAIEALVFLVATELIHFRRVDAVKMDRGFTNPHSIAVDDGGLTQQGFGDRGEDEKQKDRQ
jgi:hypothetical protein